MNVKTKTLVILLSFSNFLCLAQSISQDAISSTGGSLTAANGMLSFTSGEAMAGSYSANNSSLSQGFLPIPYTYWVGTISTAWENPLNWNGPFPSIHSDVIILPYKPRYPLVLSIASCRRLFLKLGSQVTVGSGFSLKVTK